MAEEAKEEGDEFEDEKRQTFWHQT
jgi:hypothetical protein